MGPLYNRHKPERLFACEINFKPAEDIEVRELVLIQTALHDQWKEVQGDYNARGGRRDETPLTVARAILEYFEPYVPE